MGILYALLLKGLFWSAPTVLRVLARWEGTTQRTHVELRIMNRVFALNIIVRACHVVPDKRFSHVQQGSLVLPTVSTLLFALPSGARVTIVSDSLTNLHAGAIIQDLTSSSAFFLTYVLLNFIVCILIPGSSFIMLQGVSGTAGGLLQAWPLVKYYVTITLFGSSPRSVFDIKYSPRTSDWGTLYPSTTILVVITFGYSVISPIINGFAFITFFLLYMLYKYLFTWINDHSPSSDTGGLFFPKAIHHLFVGLYVQQISLCILFFLPLGDSNKPSAIPEGALMVMLIVFTVSVVFIRALSILANSWARRFSITLYTIHIALSSNFCLSHLPMCRTVEMREWSQGLLQPGMRIRHSFGRRAMTSPRRILIDSSTKKHLHSLFTAL